MARKQNRAQPQPKIPQPPQVGPVAQRPNLKPVPKPNQNHNMTAPAVAAPKFVNSLKAPTHRPRRAKPNATSRASIRAVPGRSRVLKPNPALSRTPISNSSPAPSLKQQPPKHGPRKPRKHGHSFHP